ncbi:MAG: aminotransferase class I/II-fold pyridoxal phosphate-dependent enzyme, partial [Thermoanaerobaculia bacterium]|nr:aminotransferase class I/II-fold pyridoxal phosphate-dependent enzyme [Thermoanaerobaculia bacterium]
QQTLSTEIDAMRDAGTLKGEETVTTGVVPASGGRGPRFRIEGREQAFLKMNSNGYLGLSLDPELIAAEERAAQRYGVGPGAVRFISGTMRPHVALERRLAAFHDRQAGMIFSSAYATTLGVLVPLITPETIVLSDALNHNCIINAMRLARPAAKAVYRHLDLKHLDELLSAAEDEHRRAIVVTDGIFSMRGDHAPLDRIADIVRRYDGDFADNAILVVDDSHGVGAFGETGRGTEEVCGARADLLIATLGKALGVNGGYVVGEETVLDYLRETAPLYVYSNPITASEAAAALTAVDILDSERGRALLTHLREMTRRFEQGLVDLGFETIPGEHPVVPLMVRDTARTAALVAHLEENGVLATGLAYPVVPRGDEEIRFQISAAHTRQDIDEVLDVLASFED